MQGSIDALSFCCLGLHSFHPYYPHSISVFVGVPIPLDYSDHSSFLTADAIDEHLSRFFSVFVENRKLIPEIIEDLSVGAITVDSDEMDIIGSAV